MSRPSRENEPAVGRSSRANPRSSVDLPQAFGPTMTVMAPSGSARLRLVDDGAAVVAERDGLGAQVVGMRAAMPVSPARHAGMGVWGADVIRLIPSGCRLR